jgi:hypothetical protein
MKAQALFLLALAAFITIIPIALHAQTADTQDSIFQVVSTPSNQANNMLMAASASSPSDIWTVGYTTMHFDGKQWKEFTAPGPYYWPRRAVLDFSPTLAWSGGGFDDQGQVIDLWNGKEWTRLKKTPFPADSQPYVMTMSATSPTDIWVSGELGNQGVYNFFEHWNGKSFDNISYLGNPLGSAAAYFYGASQDAPNDAWVVGTQWLTNQQVENCECPLIVHYGGGKTWFVENPPLPQGIAYGIVYGVLALSPKNVWAVGSQNSVAPSGYTNTTLIYHFDGNSWTIVPSPTTPGMNLNGIVANSPKDMYAFGFVSADDELAFNTLVLHWDGNEWKVIPSPNPGKHPPSGWYDELSAGVVPSPGNVWIFGFQTGQKTLALHTDSGN